MTLRDNSRIPYSMKVGDRVKVEKVFYGEEITYQGVIDYIPPNRRHAVVLYNGLKESWPMTQDPAAWTDPFSDAQRSNHGGCRARASLPGEPEPWQARMESLRKAHHMTQGVAAEQLCVSQTIYGRWERCERRAPHDWVARILPEIDATEEEYQQFLDDFSAEMARYASMRAIDTYPEWAMYLKDLRKEHGLTGKQVADLAGISAGMYYAWESGARRAKLEPLLTVFPELAALAEAK